MAQPKPRKVDVFAGRGTLADRLRQRRIMIEQGIGLAETKAPPKKVMKNGS